MTTGALPPSSDRGKSFLMDPRNVDKAELVAEARLMFRAYNDRQVLITKRSMISISSKGTKFESLEQKLKTKDENG